MSESEYVRLLRPEIVVFIVGLGLCALVGLLVLLAAVQFAKVV